MGERVSRDLSPKVDFMAKKSEPGIDNWSGSWAHKVGISKLQIMVNNSCTRYRLSFIEASWSVIDRRLLERSRRLSMSKAKLSEVEEAAQLVYSMIHPTEQQRQALEAATAEMTLPHDPMLVVHSPTRSPGPSCGREKPKNRDVLSWIGAIWGPADAVCRIPV